MLDTPPSIAPGRRARGAYFTPDDVAEWMARWATSSETRLVLEPSFGDGAFLRGLQASPWADQLSVLGVEKDRATLRRAVECGHLTPDQAVCSDFLELEPSQVDAVVGNPPFVRLRHLPKAEASLALARAARAWGRRMEPSGSLWMPFLLHATSFLRQGGRLALVLPFEVTHVKYARGLWSWLGDRFGLVRLIRLHERVFDDILQDVVLLLCDDYGRTTSDIEFGAYHSLGAFFSGTAATEEKVPIAEADSGSKPFTRALLSEELRNLVFGALADRLVPVRERVTFNIGYVTGHKTFFHPDQDDIEEYGLEEAGSLIPSLSRTRDLSAGGLYSSEYIETGHGSKLFTTSRPRSALTDGERRYVEAGEADGVNERYKCRIRDPWWGVPGVTAPDLILSVFSSTPRLILNDSGAAASNSLLCGTVHEGSREQAIAAWYTSLTLLECELNVHALGGGVMILIPGEVSRIRIPEVEGVESDQLRKLDYTLREDGLQATYELGDRDVLQGFLGVTADDVELIRQGVRDLARWRERPR